MRNNYPTKFYTTLSKRILTILLIVFASATSFSQSRIILAKNGVVPQEELNKIFQPKTTAIYKGIDGIPAKDPNNKYHMNPNFGDDDERRKLIFKIFASWNPQTNDSIKELNAYDLLEESYRDNIMVVEIPAFMSNYKKHFLQHKYNLPEENDFSRLPGEPPYVMAACTNMDFESGGIGGWTGTNGINTNSSTQAGCCGNAGANFTVMTGAGTNACGGFPVVAPGGGTSSVRLGDFTTRTGRVDRLTQTFQVSPSNCVLTVMYAVVLEDGGHTAAEQPYFNIEVRNQSNALLPCGDFYVAAGAGSGFTSCGGVVSYLPWRTASFDLSALSGQNVTVTYTISDCTQTGHYGYCFIDGYCGPCAIQSNNPCSGGTQNICAPPGYATYNWTGPGGFTGNTQCVNVTAQGTYNVSGTQTGGCPVPVLSYTLAPSPIPTASFTAVNASCSSTVNFTDASTIGAGGTISNWDWNFGDPASGASNTSTTQSPSHVFSAIGTYIVTLTATSVSGCTNTYTLSVNSSGSPVANFTFATAGAAPACPGVTVNFTNTSTTPVGTTITSWNWGFGDPSSGAANTSAIASPSHTYATNGSYIVTYTVTNDQGCTGSTTQTVVINPNPVPAFTANNVCFNVCTQFTNTTPAAPAIGTWAWDFTNDGANDDATQAPCFTYASAGTFVAELTATSTAGCVGTFTTSITVNPNPVASFTATTECVNDATQFDGAASTIAAPDNIAFYNWTFGDGSSNSGITQSHTYAACGTYTANLVVVSNNNCTNNTNVTVTVKCRPTVTVPTNTVVCPATAIPATTFSSNPVGATYEWSNTVTGIGLGAGPTAGDVPAFNTTNTGSTQLDAQITVTPTLLGCIGTPSTYVVSVKPTPVMNPIANATYCPNNAVAPADFTTIPTGSTFNWTNSDPTIGLASNGASPYAGFTAINGGSTTLVSTITVTPTLALCVGLPLTYSITVNPTPVVTVPATAQYCPGDLVPASGFTSIPTGATFDWTNSDATIGVSSISPGQIGGFNATNTSAIVHDGIITVTPTLNNCPGLPVTYTITVKPTPYVNATFDVFECPQVNVPANNLTSTPAGANMSWVHTNSNVGLATTSGVNSIPAFTTTNGVAVNEISTLTITPTLNGCLGPDSSYTITVKPTPILALTPSNSYCPNVTVVPSPNFTTVPPGSTINWTNNNASIGLAASGIDDYTNFVPLNTGSTNQVAIITPTPTLNGCVGLPQTYSITVFPKPIAVVPANSEACPADPITGFVFSSIPNDPLTVYSWTHTDANVGLSQGATTAVSTASTNNFSATNVNTTLLTTNFTVITQLNGCLSDPENFTFTVNPLPTPVFEASHTCEGDATVFTSLSTVGSGTITTWQWDFDNNGSNELSGGNSAPSYAITGAGTHTIHLTVITDKSCINDVVRTMYVNPNPVPTLLVDDPDGCPDHTVLMSAAVNPTSVDHANSILSWAWDVESNGNTDSLHIYPGGSQTDALGYTYTNSSPIASQFYQVTLTATSDSGCVGTLVSTPTFITVFAHPTADFSYGPEDPQPNVQLPLVTFYDQSQGATNWLWAFNDPLSSIQANASTLQNPQHYYDNYDAGTYDVTLIINNGQCWDTIVKPVIIQPDWTFFIPNAFSPNGDGINEGFRGTGVGINKYSLMIFNRWGELIWNTEDLEKEWDGKVAGKSNAVQEDVYIWKVKFKDGKNTNHQFEGTVTVVR